MMIQILSNANIHESELLDVCQVCSNWNWQWKLPLSSSVLTSWF